MQLRQKHFVCSKGWGLSPDLIFDQIEDPILWDCGTVNFQNTLNETSLCWKVYY